MPSFGARLGDSVDRLAEHGLWRYALVPLLLSALNGRQIRNVLGADYDFHAGISFGVPIPVTDAWSFVSTPTPGGGVAVGPTALAGVVLFAVGIVLQGVLLAGYLGGLSRGVRGEPPAFGAAIREYWLPFLGFALVLLAMFLPPALLALGPAGLRGLLVLWLLVFVVGGYLLYAAPFLIVLHDVGLGRALGWSVSLATDGGAYLRYAAAYAVVVLLISVPATLVVANLSILGVLIGIVGLAPVGLVLDTATLVFVGDLTDAAGFGGENGRAHRAGLSPAPDEREAGTDSA
ncbi:hypothetical protein [Halolamina sp. C58]|uniref:hypothetical protein n=1 Tax=Halolamina sp. C58 TaxID=3421640 RepID=UPI003EBD3DA7